VLEGSATPAQQDRASRLVAALGKDVNVVNLLTLPGSGRRQILVRAKVVDIDRSATQQLGVEWGPLLSDGARMTVGPQPFVFGEVRPGGMGIEDGGPIRRLDPIGAQLRALVDASRARILSEPNLLVMEGEKGRILVGGEVPIPVIQSVGGTVGAAITIQFKQVGVSLNIDGTVADDGVHMDLHVVPEVSAIDQANSIIVSGLVVPGFSTRRAETWLHIRSGQTLVIGGLYQDTDARTVRKIPVLGDIPVLGEFFKTRQTTKRRSELLIFVTPEIVTSEAPGRAECSAPANLQLCPPGTPASDAPGSAPAAPAKPEHEAAK